MSAGRKPLPGVVHYLNGNPSKKTEEEMNAPKLDDFLDDTMPEPPAEVTEEPEALKEWNRIVPQLHEVGIIRTIDQTTLSAYCCAYAEWIIGLRSLRKGRLVRTRAGTYQVNPMFRVVKEASAQMARFLTEFGLTPSSRVRLKPGGKKGDGDHLDKEMFGE